MEAITTRVGQIVDGDNRFLGRSVFEDWVKVIQTPTDALLLSLGVSDFSALNREALRLIGLCLMSPDARVWPLKLTRLLSSWGDPIAGFFGAQLVTAGKVMGPGATTSAARTLHWVREQVGEAPSTEAVAAALTTWREQDPSPIGGFGVPFREHDERRLAVVRFAGAGPLTQRPYWKLQLQFVKCLAPLEPNCALSFAAMLLDMGVAPERCGLATSALMQHVFLAHALEAAEQDGARLNAWGPEWVDYQGAGPRVTGDGQRGGQHRALRRVTAR